MIDQIELPTCTSCNRPIIPGELSVKFQCPNCNENTVWRCSKCRKFSRLYACSDCSFEGP
ncbi:MAG: zinc finger domain-containing protein [Nitrososphaerales archaeon]|nr:zinc finger domain-containing protein [Nitrososphaerales archaeon]